MTLTDFVWLLGTYANLWLEQGRLDVPPNRQQIDGNVQAFQPWVLSQIVVLGADGNLWFEQATFVTVPPKRQLVDGNVCLRSANAWGSCKLNE
jgi:hypothetical protein